MIDNENLVFKALADPNRRQILDMLFQADGRSIIDVTNHLEITRFGVMKHMKVLEEAGLVTSKKVGREKLHYLNPVPIQQIHDRWVSKYAEPWAVALGELKQAAEQGGREAEEKKE